MKSSFAYRSRFPGMIERFIPRQRPKRAKDPLEDVAYSGYVCPRCFSVFVTPELRKTHRKRCGFDRLAAKAAQIEPRLSKMNPRQRERVEAAIKEEFLKLVMHYGP